MEGVESMDLFRIETTTYNSTDLIEGYDSLIWTERWQTPGDFQLRTHKINATMAALPLGSMVAIRQSREIMRVEDYSVDKDEAGDTILTLTGRSLMAFMENRFAIGSKYPFIDFRNEDDPTRFDGAFNARLLGGSTPWNDGDAIKWLIEMHMAYGYYMFDLSDPSSVNPEKVPNLVVDNLDNSGKTTSYLEFVPRVNLYDEVYALLQAGDNGFRIRRPLGSETKMHFQIYNGTNRTVNQTATPQILLDQENGDITNVKQAKSIRDYRNSFRIYNNYSDVTINPVWNSAGALIAPNRMGWNFLDQHVDADNIKEDDAAMKSRRLKKEIAKGKQKSIINAEVPNDIRYAFGVHYNMGDIITVRGFFNVEQPMRVTEYIRTEDSTSGYTAYPTISEL